MNRVAFGIIAGVLFGAVDVALMLPLKFENRATAFAAAFASRFAIGLLASTVDLPLPPWTRGLLVGLLISIPDAIITKAYVPILTSGILGGAIIGWAAGRWALPAH
jgi:hypothetical protein